MSKWEHVKLKGIFLVWIMIIKLKFILMKHVIYRSSLLLLLLLWFIIIDYKKVVGSKHFWMFISLIWKGERMNVVGFRNS